MPKQFDWLEDDFSKPQIFDCIAGSYIGHFNQQSGQPDQDPITRLSDFMSREAAENAIQKGEWPEAEPE